MFDVEKKFSKNIKTILFQIPEEKELEDVSDNTDKISSSYSGPNESANSVESIEKSYEKTNSNTILSLNEVSLDDFEKRQKMIKEQNRQRKELLKKALEDRFVEFVMFCL